MSGSEDEELYENIDDFRALIEDEQQLENNAGTHYDEFMDENDEEYIDPDDVDLMAEFSDDMEEEPDKEGPVKKTEAQEPEEDQDEQDFMDAIREANNFKVKRKKKSGGYKRVKTVDPELAQLLAEANDAYVRQDIAVAEQMYSEVIKKDAKNFAAFRTLGDIYHLQGRLNDCCNSWFLAAHLNPGDWEFWKIVGSLSNELNHHRQAMYCFSKALSVNPEDSECLYERSMLYKRTGQLGRAMEGFQRLYAKHPFDSELVRELAVLYVDYGKAEKAVEMYLKIYEQNVRKRHFIKSYLEEALESSDEEDVAKKKTNKKPLKNNMAQDEFDSDEDEDYGSIENEPGYLAEDYELNALPKKQRLKYRCIFFDWSSLNILIEVYLKHNGTEPVKAINVVKKCARWIQHRENQIFWNDVTNDSEFDDRRERNANYMSLPPIEHEKKYFLPIDIRVRLGLLRIKSKNVVEAMHHFDFLKAETFEDVMDLYYEVGKYLTEAEKYAEALELLEPLCDIEGYDTLEYNLLLGKCYRALELYDKAAFCYEKIVVFSPENLHNKLTLAEMYYHTKNPERFNVLLTEVVETRKLQQEEKDQKEKNKLLGIDEEGDVDMVQLDTNLTDGNVVHASSGIVNDNSVSAKPLMVNIRPIKTSFKRKRRPEEMENYKKEREKKITSSVVDRFNKLYIYKIGLENGDSNQLSLWIDTASDLVDIFTSVRNLFLKSRSQKFVGIITRARKYHKILDYKIERLAKLSEGENLVDGIPVTDEKVPLDQNELRGLTYDQWFELFMELALIITREQSIDDGLSIIETAEEINVFAGDENRVKMMKFVKFTIISQLEDNTEKVELLRALLNQYQFDRKLMQMFLLSISDGGEESFELYNSRQLQKFFLRHLKAFDSTRFGIHVTGQSAIINVSIVDNPQHLPSPYLSFIYGMLLYSSKGYLAALHYLHSIENRVGSDPIFNLSVGLAYLHRSMQRLTPSRNFQILYGFHYLYQYYQIRSENFTEIEEQEADYNLARSFHFLGLNTPAVRYYYRVLNNYKDERLKRHAAFNLIQIFNQSESAELAEEIMEKYLSV
ncbi:hypothetical protein ACO0RG_001712 [Hanseniaspora osmophila]|uniref:Transcription factor tau subunit n=1 Tax=Hanseniaspora osmophila TaxID=56408 RepID=A0A1E5RGH6_9ASCO|nr:Transcription factor tau subunit [Hanseniaspora osmophila]